MLGGGDKSSQACLSLTLHATRYLDSQTAIAEYLTAIIEDGVRHYWQRRLAILPKRGAWQTLPNRQGLPAKRFIKHFGPTRSHALIPLLKFARRLGSSSMSSLFKPITGQGLFQAFIQKLNEHSFLAPCLLYINLCN